MRRTGLAGVVLAVVCLTMVGAASGSTLCLQLKANGAVKGPTTVGGNTCKGGYEKIELPPAAQLETLNKILPHTKYEENGVGGKPTIQFSGVNVQVVSGAGKTNAAVNGEGNLVIGYDENGGGHAQTGSHDLVLGEEQTFTSFGGIVAGRSNTISGPFASVTGGFANTASGEYASVSGGLEGNASALLSWVGGGGQNKASFREAAVSGGFRNEATGENASVSGGVNNIASASFASVSGGDLNRASGAQAWVGGGFSNNASGRFASIFGGKELTASAPFEAIP
jgi:hypothetical protein